MTLPHKSRTRARLNWQIESTLGDLKLSVSQVEDKDTRDRLQAILETLGTAQLDLQPTP
jgi:hypothetical protein